MLDELKGKLKKDPNRPVVEKKKTGFFSHKLYIALFIVAFVYVWVSLFWLHRISIKSLFSIVPDVINLIPDVIKEFIQGIQFHLGFKANAFRNFLISRIIFRALFPLLFILLFAAGLRHRRGKFKREKALTIATLVITVYCLIMRVYSDYCYRLSYTVSHLNDDEIYHKLSYLLFGEQLKTRGVTNFYIFVILGLIAVIVLSLVIQTKQARGEKVDYKGYRILCIFYVVMSFFLPILNGKYFQGHVLCMSIALLTIMVFLGTSLEVKLKNKKGQGAAIPEDKMEIPLSEPQVQEPETRETAEPSIYS